MQDNIKILIIDAQSMLQNHVNLLLQQEGYFQNTFVQSTEKAKKRLAKETFDLIIYKLNNEEIELGIWSKSLFDKTHTPLIFIVDSLSKTKFDYLSLPGVYAVLVDPVNNLTFRSTVKVFFQQRALKEAKYSILVKKGKESKVVEFSEINWIKSDGNYCYIYTEKQEHAIRTTIKKLRKMLPLDLFIQVHRSHLVAIQKIESISPKNKILIVAGAEIPIGRMYKNALLDKLNII